MNTITHLDAPKPRMKGPPKLNLLMDEMLEQIKQTPDLAEQSTLFVIDQKHGSANSRWIYAECVLPMPWILWREAGDDIQQLLVTSNVTKRILVFESANGVQWKRDRAVNFDEVDSVIPRPHIHTSWMAKSATKKQVELIAEVAGRPKEELPPMSIFNVSALIHIRRMAAQSNVIDYMVRCWEYDIETSYGKQEVLYPGLF